MKRTFILLCLPVTAIIGFFFMSLQDKGAWVAPEEAERLQNPLAGEKAGAKGENTFAFNCERCHGISGKGDGVDGATLDPKPSDLTSERVQKQSDGAIFWKISTGRGEMKSFKKELDEKDRWRLVNYIRQLAGNKGRGEK